MGSRRKGRIIAFQALFGWDVNKASLAETLGFPWMDEHEREQIDAETLAFAAEIVSGTIDHIAAIDDTIRANLKNWDFSRLARVDLAMLRMSVYALAHQSEIPANVTIDEAIDIVKEYGTDDSYRFVNGVLDGIRKNLQAIVPPTESA